MPATVRRVWRRALALVAAGAILVPTLMGLPLEKQQEVGGRRDRRSSQILLPVAALVVTLG